jgi:ribosomal protein S27AE
MNRGAQSRCSDTAVKRPRGRRQKGELISLEPEVLTVPPPVCTKPGCGGRFFIPHEDGWQCWNCMKVIYRNQPLVLADSDSQ